ncbi:MAG: glycosyltransferase [Desulfobacterales bacterium]|nr:glycosyltransferase [Desulfobacterales bacterium]
MKVKVLLSRSASNRYRFPQFVPYLVERGMDIELFNMKHTQIEFLRVLSKLKEADIVVILRKLFPPWKLRLIRRYAKKLIFEYDDAIMYRSSRWANQYSRTRQGRFTNMIRASDLIIAGSHYLQKEAMRYVAGDRVQVIPTVVDIERYAMKQETSYKKEEVTLGWIGSQSTLHYLKTLLPVFAELGRRFPFVQLKIVCNAFFDVPTMRVIKKEWSEADEVADLQGFDIGLGPLPDDVWTRGKCGFKLIQCLAVGVPVVCSPVGANK